MLDDLNELRTLQQVLACGSLTAAAKALGVSLAVVSKRLATLERRTGVRLVNRTTRSLSPTEEGERLLVVIDRVLGALRQGEELLSTGRDEPVGTLRVSAPVSFGRRHVAAVLGDLARRHPQLKVALSLDDRLIDVARVDRRGLLGALEPAVDRDPDGLRRRTGNGVSPTILLQWPTNYHSVLWASSARGCAATELARLALQLSRSDARLYHAASRLGC